MLKNSMRIVIVIISVCFFALTLASEKRFIVAITSYNNKDWYKRNLDSILSQNYSNYQIVYIDDCSTDGTGAAVQAYMQESGIDGTVGRIRLIQNTERQYKLANLYRLIHECHDNDIIVEFDGDDWLAHPNVLSDLNTVYDDPNVWVAYGQFVDWPTNCPGYALYTPSYMIKDASYRRFWNWSGLRTYHSWLAKRIRLEDLLFSEEHPTLQGKFFPAASDAALTYPMLEMAGGKIRFISSVVLIRNVATPLNDFKAHQAIQKACGSVICKQQPYPVLAQKPPLLVSQRRTLAKGHVGAALIFATTTPADLHELLNSYKEYCGGVARTYVVYTPKNKQEEKAYNDLKDTFNWCAFLEASPGAVYSTFVLRCLTALPAQYITLLTSDMRFKNTVNIQECIAILEKTKAYAFYLTNAEEQAPAHTLINKTMAAWFFKFGKDSGQSRNTLRGAIYRKKALIDLCASKQSPTYYAFEKSWASYLPDQSKLGLFFKPARVLLTVCDQ